MLQAFQNDSWLSVTVLLSNQVFHFHIIDSTLPKLVQYKPIGTGEEVTVVRKTPRMNACFGFQF